MSATTERILIVILLIVAVIFAVRDARAGTPPAARACDTIVNLRPWC